MSADRDKWTDASRDGRGQQRKEDVGYELLFGPQSVYEEKLNHGYQNKDVPTGAKKVAPNRHSGNRGARDIGA